MKSATYQVRITFDGELTERQKDDIVENILNSLLHTVNTAGLVPDDSGATTDTIVVSRMGSGASLGRDVNTGELI